MQRTSDDEVLLLNGGSDGFGELARVTDASHATVAGKSEAELVQRRVQSRVLVGYRVRYGG